MLRLNNIATNKAELQIGDITILFSYNTPVAALVPGIGWIKTDKKYSKTTTKHINSWLGDKLYVNVVPQAYIDSLLHN